MNFRCRDQFFPMDSAICSSCKGIVLKSFSRSAISAFIGMRKIAQSRGEGIGECLAVKNDVVDFQR